VLQGSRYGALCLLTVSVAGARLQLRRRIDLEAAPMPSLLSNACVVLVRTQGPVNLGMVARLCGNLGVTDLRLVAPLCAVNSDETRMFSTHSQALLLGASVFPDLSSALTGCSIAIGTSARPRGKDYGEALSLAQIPEFLTRKHASTFALVFGNEATGLTEAELMCCQGWLHLETFGPNTSYNLSHAVAITLYYVATSCSVPVVTETKAVDFAANRDSVMHLYQYWISLLERFQYFRRADRERFIRHLQRFFNRMDLSDRDVQILWGMLAQFQMFTFGDRGIPAEVIEKPLAQESPTTSEGLKIEKHGEIRREGEIK
jgi:tRNA/rRNA methyltransferase